jgi:hypothetical protein
VINAGGCLGSGARQYIFFRDPDYLVPQCLGFREMRPGQRFLDMLKRVARNLGAVEGFGDSKTEENLLNFLYEAVTNANEHGARSIIGIRGITVGKMIFKDEQELLKRDLPHMLTQYCRRAWAGRKSPLVLLSFTVSDLGPGIQNTLPSLAGESSRERLMRAFRYGVSCKPTGSDTTRGHGLTKILDSASTVRALLIITSANLLAYRDFSQEQKPYDGDIVIHQKELSVPAGTSLTLLWEPSPISPEQRTLEFPAR